MTMQEFSRDFVPVLQLLISALGLISIVLLWWQIRQTTLWNKLQSHHTFFKETPNPQYERSVHDKFKAMGFDLDEIETLNEQAMKMLAGDVDAIFAARNYLNEYEELCAAVRIGTVDEDFAYAMDAVRVLKAYRIFKPFIDMWRERLKSEEPYIELEKVALAWQRRRIATQAQQHQRIERLKQKIEEEKNKQGIKKPVI